MSTPTKAAEIIRHSIETAMARIGCPPGDNADADIYRDLQRSLSLLADIDGGGKVVAWPVVDYKTIPDDGDLPLVLSYLRACALSWEPGVRILGNLRSVDLVRVLNELEKGHTHPSPTAADAPPEADSRTPVDLWISVKDRLPGDSRTVLVRMPNGTPKLAWYMDTSQGQSMWFDPSTDCRMYPVKWMEIPE